jgi:cob(I)alamin adenosyltransferase
VGHRLSRIVTRTGDHGTTGLGDGSRVPKDSLRIGVLGDIDETNAAIGLVLAQPGVPAHLRDTLLKIQHQLFDLGGELCIPGHATMTEDDVEWLEQRVAEWNAVLPPLKEFILPGGGLAATHCHLARTICRRAERNAVALSRSEQVRQEALVYLNRLSDALFVASRVLARENGLGETLWRRELRHGPPSED